LNQFADAVAARSGNGGGMMNLILNLDGLQIASNVVEYLNNGVVTIDMKRAARA
jgi:hypothetical protein